MKNFNLTDWALSHRAVVLFLILVLAIAGVISFTKLGQLGGPQLLRAVNDRHGHVAGRYV